MIFNDFEFIKIYKKWIEVEETNETFFFFILNFKKK